MHLEAQVPLKVCHFFWFIGQECISITMNLVRKGLDLDQSCLVCAIVNEDLVHLFLDCPLVKIVRQRSRTQWIKRTATSMFKRFQVISGCENPSYCRKAISLL